MWYLLLKHKRIHFPRILPRFPERTGNRIWPSRSFFSWTCPRLVLEFEPLCALLEAEDLSPHLSGNQSEGHVQKCSAFIHIEVFLDPLANLHATSSATNFKRTNRDDDHHQVPVRTPTPRSGIVTATNY